MNLLDTRVDHQLDRYHHHQHRSYHAQRRYEICFVSLFAAGRSLSFPCDALGRVDLDSLTERARANYLFARAMVGRDYSPPSIEPAFA